MNLPPRMLEAILGRPEQHFDRAELVRRLAGERILITGAAGSIGSALAITLAAHKHPAFRTTDVHDMDVTKEGRVAHEIADYRPSLVIHLAGAKHAPLGELEPEETVAINVDGTRNVLAAAAFVNARVITASTCKAADPETVYGATKLIAERMTLNEGQHVLRFYNVVEASGNVFEQWAALPDDAPVPVVVKCRRWLISRSEAVGCLLELAAGDYPPARYSPSFAQLRDMGDVAAVLYPAWRIEEIPPRRGDRIAEPMRAQSEFLLDPWHPETTLVRVMGPHDAGAQVTT